MCPSLRPHVLQPATLCDAGERGARLRQHAAGAAHLRRARARQAHGSRPAPLVVVDACTSSCTRLHSSQYVPVIARSARLLLSGFRRVDLATVARAYASMVKPPGSPLPMRPPTATEARPCPPACSGPPLWPSAGVASPRCLDSEARLRRRSGAGPKSPIPLPLTIQVRGVVRRACRASSRAGGVAGSRVHAQQRRSEHRVAVRSGRRVK
eukprot:scaffold43948_cov67-Phaeocystis_antarctica.AAC.7